MSLISNLALLLWDNELAFPMCPRALPLLPLLGSLGLDPTCWRGGGCDWAASKFKLQPLSTLQSYNWVLSTSWGFLHPKPSENPHKVSPLLSWPILAQYLQLRRK